MRVLIAYDGSHQSVQALHFLKHFPLHRPAFHIVNVVTPVAYDQHFVAEGSAQRIDQYNDTLFLKSNELLKEAQNILGPQNVTTSTMEGMPAERIIQASKKFDLIVIGSRGLSSVASLFFDSVSDTVIHQTHCPILLVRFPNTEIPEPDSIRIVVGYDDTPHARETCQFIKNMDLDHIESVDIISAIQMGLHYGVSHSLIAMETWPQQQCSLEESMLAMSREIKAQHDNLRVDVDIIQDAYNAADNLIDYANHHHNNLIAVGSKDKSFLDRILLGSTSDKLAHAAPCPVLITKCA